MLKAVQRSTLTVLFNSHYVQFIRVFLGLMLIYTYTS